MRRWLIWLVALGLVATACSNRLGADTPECVATEGAVELPVSLIMQAQSVPDAHYGPCVSELRVGWEVSTMHTRSGRSWFWLDSDRIGSRFVEVSLEASCDIGSAVGVPFDVFNVVEGLPPDSEAVELYEDVDRGAFENEFAVVPVAERHLDYAREVAASLRRRGYLVLVSAGEESFGERMADAAGSGAAVLVADDLDIENGTISVRMPGEREEESGVSLTELLDRFAGDVDDEAYRALWYFVFEGGCITYEFDAKGPGAEALPNQILGALKLFPLELMRQAVRDQGFDI